MGQVLSRVEQDHVSALQIPLVLARLVQSVRCNNIKYNFISNNKPSVS